MRPAFAVSALAAGWLAIAGRTEAQQPPPDSIRRDTTRTLQAVRVVAERAPVVTAVGGVSVVSITPDSLRLSPAPALRDVLREIPFVLVRQNSRGESELSIRGSESRQSAILLDRIPLTIGWDSRTDPSLVPMSGARSIAVVRGLSSLLEGPNVLGGVVSIDINSGESDETSDRALALRTGTDHLGATATSASLVAPWLLTNARLTLRAGGGYRYTSGVALSDAVSDPTARNDRRTNSDARQVDGYVAMRYSSDWGPWVGISATGYSGERGVPPELHLSEPRLWRYPDASRMLAIASAGTGRQRTGWGSGDMELVVALNEGDTEIEDYGSLAYDAIVGREFDEERTLTTRLLADHSLGRGELRTAFTYANVRFREQFDTDAPSRYEQRLWSAATEIEQPLAGLWRVNVGVALDGSDTPETGGKPSLGRLSDWAGRFGLSTVLPEAGARLHASVSTRSRFASLRELYSGSLGRFEPNPDLQPERLVGGEAGLTFIRSQSQLQAVVFHQQLSDAVVRISTPNGNFMRVNRDQMRSSGVELLGAIRTGEVSWNGDLMLQHVRLSDPAASGADRRPEHVPEFRVGGSAAFPFWLQARGAVAMSYTGSQYCVNTDLGRTVRLSSQTRTDVSLEREWQVRSEGMLSRLRGLVSIDNVTDAAIYSQCGLPEPGRTLRIGMILH
ncbi:MAG TPA: TonB-dependent receptor [Gemmatimonadaceae bacterium]|nr:TonB-dependent receptor [Gemmatimonadaceae bacterium]